MKSRGGDNGKKKDTGRGYIYVPTVVFTHSRILCYCTVQWILVSTGIHNS